MCRLSRRTASRTGGKEATKQLGKRKGGDEDTTDSFPGVQTSLGLVTLPRSYQGREDIGESVSARPGKGGAGISHKQRLLISSKCNHEDDWGVLK